MSEIKPSGTKEDYLIVAQEHLNTAVHNLRLAQEAIDWAAQVGSPAEQYSIGSVSLASMIDRANTISAGLESLRKTKGMGGDGRGMWMVQNKVHKAFFEKAHRAQAEELRKSDPRLKHARIVDVLQLRPDLVIEGEVYTRTIGGYYATAYHVGLETTNDPVLVYNPYRGV